VASAGGGEGEVAWEDGVWEEGEEEEESMRDKEWGNHNKLGKGGVKLEG
jgi:hypothetical protein